MANFFESSRRKLARGQEHVQNFKGEVGRFLDQKPYAVVVDPHPHFPGGKIHKVKLTQPIPASLADIAADAAGNLRASLDQAGYAVAVASGCRNPKYTAFPFSGSAEKLENSLNGRSKNIPREFFPLLRAFKPYKGGDDLLCSLNDICNRDKHITFVPVAIGNTFLSFATHGISDGKPFGFFCAGTPKWDGDELVLLEQRSADAQANYNFDLSFCISFSEIDPIVDKPADRVLNALASKVESILLAIEAEARRLGIFR